MDPGEEEAGDQDGEEAGDSGEEPESSSEDVPKVLTAVYPICICLISITSAICFRRMILT